MQKQLLVYFKDNDVSEETVLYFNRIKASKLSPPTPFLNRIRLIPADFGRTCLTHTTTFRILVWSVTSSGSTCNRDDACFFRFAEPFSVKQPAITGTPCLSSNLANSFPNPESQPVMKT